MKDRINNNDNQIKVKVNKTKPVDIKLSPNDEPKQIKVKNIPSLITRIDSIDGGSF